MALLQDTAEVYPVVPRAETSGATSTILGKWLAKQQRSKFVIASKVTGIICLNPHCMIAHNPAAIYITHPLHFTAGRSPALDWIPKNRRSASDPPAPPSTPKLDGRSIIAAAELELRRLGTDYIDLFQLHWPDRYVGEEGGGPNKRG